MVLAVPSQDTYTVGQILTSASLNKNVRDAVSFLAAPPMFTGVQSAAQSIPNNTQTALTLDTTSVDTYSGHNNVTNNSRYTAQVAGWYLVTGKVNFGASATAGQRAVQLGVNGTLINPSQVNFPVAAAFVSPPSIYTVYLNVGDYVETFVYQTTGATITLGANYSQMSVLWVHS